MELKDKLIENIKENPNNLLDRISLSEILFEEIIDNISNNNEVPLGLLNLLEEHSQYISKIKDFQDGEIYKLLSKLSSLILAHTNFIKGNLKDSICNCIEFYNVINSQVLYEQIEENSILNNKSLYKLNLIELKIGLIYNIIQILKILNLNEEIEELCEKNGVLVSEKMNRELMYLDGESRDIYIKEQSNRIFRIQNTVNAEVEYCPIMIINNIDNLKYIEQLNLKCEYNDIDIYNIFIFLLEIKYYAGEKFIKYNNLNNINKNDIFEIKELIKTIK